MTSRQAVKRQARTSPAPAASPPMWQSCRTMKHLARRLPLNVSY